MKTFRRPRSSATPYRDTAYANQQGRVLRDTHRRPDPDTVILPNQIYEQRRPHYEYRIPSPLVYEVSSPSSVISLLRSLFSGSYMKRPL